MERIRTYHSNAKRKYTSILRIRPDLMYKFEYLNYNLQDLNKRISFLYMYSIKKNQELTRRKPINPCAINYIANLGSKLTPA